MRSLGAFDLARAWVVVALAVATALLGSGCREDDIEKELGRGSAAAIEHAYDISRDPLINEWVNNAGHTLVSHSRRQQIPYEFKVIETDLVNAFAAPYGHIYVTTGFLDFAESEDEVWVVLGHEIGHVVNRDSIKSFKRSLLMSILAAILRSESRTIGDAAGIGLGLLSLRYSRKDEYAADDSGTLLAYRAGYDPNASIAFFNRLRTDIEERRPSKWEVYFMTHPPTERRIGRQQMRPELDGENVEALTQIGRGYLRRAHNAGAIQYLTQAAQLAPESVDLQTALGDAYTERGEFDRAAEHYSTALSLSPDDRYAETQLTAVEGKHPYQLPGIGTSGREQATALLAKAHGLESTAHQTIINAASYGASLSGEITDLVGLVKQINQRLMSLAEENVRISEAGQQLVIRGNAAITRANESVYILESVNEDFDTVSEDLLDLLAMGQGQLAAAESGHGDPTDMRAMRNATTELKRGLGTIDLAMSEAPKTVTKVRAAQAAAEKTTGVLERLVRTPRLRRTLADELRASATHTSSQAVEALHAANRAQRMSVKARGHALLARINLIGVGASPELQQLFDKQISHHLLCPPAQVRALRNEDVGYGEAAYCIAAAKSLGTRPGHFLVQEGKAVSPVGSALQEGAAVANANALLKFLAVAMEQEQEGFDEERVN